jgi:hypothetical protein
MQAAPEELGDNCIKRLKTLNSSKKNLRGGESNQDLNNGNTLGPI